MSYLERIIIGAIIVISAFSLYNNSEQRHQFHQAVRQIAKLLGRCLGCYNCIEHYRQIIVILVFTGGISLLIDTGVFIAILAHLVITALQIASFNGLLTIIELKSLLVSVAILLFLFKNWSEQKNERKISQVKPAVQGKQVQKGKVEGQVNNSNNGSLKRQKGKGNE